MYILRRENSSTSVKATDVETTSGAELKTTALDTAWEAAEPYNSREIELVLGIDPR
jgi:hypothetical protein